MNTQLEFATEKLGWLEYACINCHPSMKAYYQGLYAAQKEHIELLKIDIKKDVDGNFEAGKLKFN